MNDNVLERLKSFYGQQEKQRKSEKTCCENCCWFAAGNANEKAGRCFRFPPVATSDAEIELASDLVSNIPKVTRDWACGEFRHKQTGESFQHVDPLRIISSLRARVGELEDQIKWLRAEANS